MHLLTSKLIFLRNDLPESYEKNFMLIKKNENKKNKESFIISSKKRKKLIKKNLDLYIINKDLTIKRILLIYFSFLNFKLLILFVIKNIMIVNNIIKFVSFDYNLKDMKPD